MECKSLYSFLKLITASLADTEDKVTIKERLVLEGNVLLLLAVKFDVDVGITGGIIVVEGVSWLRVELSAPFCCV